jgi:hypothetical protein
VTERPHLCRGPQDRARNQDDRGNALDADRVANPKQVGEGCEAAPPQRNREHESHENQAKRVAERLGGPERYTFAVRVARRPDDGFRSEPCRENGKRRKRVTELAPGDEVIGFALYALADPNADSQLEREIEEDEGELERHARKLGKVLGVRQNRSEAYTNEARHSVNRRAWL